MNAYSTIAIVRNERLENDLASVNAALERIATALEIANERVAMQQVAKEKGRWRRFWDWVDWFNK